LRYDSFGDSIVVGYIAVGCAGVPAGCVWGATVRVTRWCVQPLANRLHLQRCPYWPASRRLLPPGAFRRRLAGHRISGSAIHAVPIRRNPIRR
jgi:hypothetical protein